MDRQAFKQRMQQLKQYREQNPGKTYLDWKNSLPSNLQDESNYNLRRAYELGYEPEWNEDDKSYHLPTRDSETGEILKKPWHPTFLIGLQEDAKLGYYPQIKNGTMYTTTWEGNENPIYKYADGGEIPPNNKPIIPEQPQLYKGKLYKDRYGRNMTRDMYNNILQGTEIKSYMNQFRNYLDQKGKLNRGNYTGSYKNLKKEIIDAPRESFNNIKAIFNLYRSPKLFNKDFQMIPIVNNNDNNTIV